MIHTNLHLFGLESGFFFTHKHFPCNKCFLLLHKKSSNHRVCRKLKCEVKNGGKKKLVKITCDNETASFG